VSPDRDGLTVRSLESLDITQRFGAVTLADVLLPHAALLGEPGTAGVEVERAFQTALVLVLAETVGAAAALLSLTTEYAKDRTAFGRPIGSFQALKHQLADLALALEATKAIAVQATRAAQAQSADCSSMVSIAKVWAGEAAIDIAQGCLQVFGGIGYTWEHDLHLYLRRLTMSSQLYGGPRWHRDRIWAMQAAQPDTTDLS
jgi:alkylation response protein AidB-like acyl-CoA dehydrogenase